MTNEAVRLVAAGTAPANPINFIISDGANGGVEKGTIMVLSGAYICGKSLATSLGTPFAGFANTEKVAGDGSTTIGLDTCGVYDCLVLGSGTDVAVGDLLMLSGANTLAPIKTKALSGAIYIVQGGVVGEALEPIAATTVSDTIAVAAGIY